MKQTLLSLAALIGFAGAAKAQTTITLWDAKDPIELTWNQTQVIKNVTAFEIGDKLVAHIAERLDKDPYPQVVLKDNDWTNLGGTSTIVNKDVTSVEITLTENHLNTIKSKGGFFLSGISVTVSKLDWIPVRKYSEGKKLTTDEWFNIYKSEFEGANDEAIIVFNYKLEAGKAEDIVNWAFGTVQSKGDETKSIDCTYGGLPNANVSFALKFSEIKDFLVDKDPQYGSQGIWWNAWSNNTYKVTRGEVYLYNTASTPIANIEASDAEVVSTTYYSITGAASAEPAKGMNVVKEQLSDGNVRIRKIMVK